MRIAFLLLAAAIASAESLNYNITLASGSSLGEASLDSSQNGGWSFSANLLASLPGFTLKDQYTSTSDAKFCSATLTKLRTRGPMKSEERVGFDQSKQEASRETVGGGKSTVNTSACARDPFALLQFIRKELADGRMASQHSIVFGAPYQVRFEYAGVQLTKAGGKTNETEKIQTTVKGPGSDVTFELYFLRDAARTPLLARIPSPLGQLVVELVR